MIVKMGEHYFSIIKIGIWPKCGSAFPCCMSNDTSSNKRRPRRKKIDPSMIGAPQNFVHLNHIGSGEPTGSDMQDHMQSKGGYEEKSDVNVQRKLDDVRPEGS
uniref:CDC42 small effector protein 2-like n=1 Tax=Styela clava TaxID=7725 RepID=UPI00193A6762|nr:CDC42 small effector protein 2-like [Styela clava]